MLRSLSGWLERRRRNRIAVEVAVRHFESTTGQRAHAGISSVIGEEAGGLVVRVCFGEVKPPRRAWYRIGEGSVVDELSFEEAGRFGERPWR